VDKHGASFLAHVHLQVGFPTHCANCHLDQSIYPSSLLSGSLTYLHIESFEKQQMVAFTGAYIGLRLSILPLPRSAYMSDSADMAANNYGSVDCARDVVC
jgi:hypothetical protein